MHRIRAALGNQGDLRAGSTPELRPGVSSDRAELLHGIKRYAQNARKRIAVLLIVYIDAIQSHIALVRFAAIHGAAPVVGRRTRLRLAQIRHPGCSDSNPTTLRASNGN